MRSLLSGLKVVLLLLTTSVPALAQSADAATAELLFQQGRDLLRAGKSAEACPKLAESQRLDPATGTLLALAMCHQAEGKLASAWAEFTTVQTLARSENRLDREEAAREQANALKGKLSTLEIRVPAEVAALAGLKVIRDGVELGRGAWNIEAPIDGGPHRIEVTATGKQAYFQQLVLANEHDRQVLQIPSLRDAAPVKVAPPLTAPTDGDPRPDSDNRPWGALEWSGIGVASAGIVALGVGGYFLSQALAENSDSKQDCNDRGCGDQGYADRTDAVSHGNAATAFGIAGAVLVGGGVTLFIVGRSQGDRRPASRASSPSLALGLSPFAARLSGRFQ